jgi:hypothetical protein
VHVAHGTGSEASHNTDSSCPYHTSSLAEEIESNESFECEILPVDTRVCQVSLSIEGQDERNRVFGHRMGRVRRHPEHRQAKFPCGIKVNIVVPSRSQCHQSRATCIDSLKHGGV